MRHLKQWFVLVGSAVLVCSWSTAAADEQGTDPTQAPRAVIKAQYTATPVTLDGALDELVDLLRAEHGGHPLPQLLAAEQLGQVVLQHAFKLQVTKEDLQRHKMAGDRRGASFFACSQPM